MALEEFNHYFKDNKKYYNEEEIDNGTINFKPVVMLYRKWSTINEAQYEPIAKFWEIVEEYVSLTSLQGFGTDWSDTDFLYGIIFTDGNVPDECLNEVRQMFNDIQLDYSFMIPDNYEQTYEGDINNIKPLYDEIWSKGPLAYELEEYPDEKTIKVHVIYKQPVIQESKLPSSKRKKLKDSDFALVYTDENGKKVRKYPVHDEDHVRAAAKMFPRGVPLKYKKQVAHKILRKAHEFGIDTDGWNSVNAYKGKD